MAIRIELDEQLLKAAIELQIGSLKRAINTAKNPKFKPLLEEDIRRYTLAMSNMTDVK